MVGGGYWLVGDSWWLVVGQLALPPESRLI